MSYFSGSLDSLITYWNRKYRAEKFKKLSTRQKAVEIVIKEIAPILKNTFLWIDLGSGAGGIEKYVLSKDFNPNIIAVDFSFAMIENFLTPEFVNRIVADARDNPLKNQIADFVSSFFVWSDYPTVKTPLKEFYRLLKTGGYGLIVDYASGDSYWELRKMLHGYKDIVGNINLRTPKEVIRVMKKIGFEIIKGEYISYQVPFDSMPQLITSTELALMKFQNPDFYNSYLEYMTKQIHARRFYYVIGRKNA